MIKITLNDEEMSLAQGSTVQALLEQLSQQKSERLAVAVNDAVVSRSQWPEYQLQESDAVLIIAPIQGG